MIKLLLIVNKRQTNVDTYIFIEEVKAIYK